MNQTVLNVKADGTRRLESQRTSLGELNARLKELARLFPDYAIILRGDERTDYKSIVAVLDICRDANIWNVQFATSKPE